MKDERNSSLLVIGYGNALRSDDGVGPRVAEAVGALNLPGVRALACHQLVPELAETVARARAVVFVDAALGATEKVRCDKLDPAESTQLLAHAADPRGLLALAQRAFGRAPVAWWLTVPAPRVGFGEELSPTARRGLEEAVAIVRTLAEPE